MIVIPSEIIISDIRSLLVYIAPSFGADPSLGAASSNNLVRIQSNSTQVSTVIRHAQVRRP
jgi:hypothetical protein